MCSQCRERFRRIGVPQAVCADNLLLVYKHCKFAEPSSDGFHLGVALLPESGGQTGRHWLLDRSNHAV